MKDKNLLKKSKAYYEDNDYYEIFSIAEDGENKVKKYLEGIGKNKIILDAGCGTGKFLAVLEKEAKKYIGIDLSQNQLNKAKEKALKESSEFKKSDLSKIDLDNESVDIVVSSWVLGTIIDIDERNKCLNELKRVLKKGGKIILVENAENSEFEDIRNHADKTKLYNEWILGNNFKRDKKFETYFAFKNAEEARKCFDVIYGNVVANKIKSKIVGHNIGIYNFVKE